MRRETIICLLLIVVTLVVFWQVRKHDFVDFDDDVYVTRNIHVQSVITKDSIVWAFTTTREANWHPLTWLSHMVDYQLFGLDPKGHHLTSVLFHLANTLLCFLVLTRMTGANWRSAFVAALFALHPLHVESVAWVAERKDVLSTLFWMLTLWAYTFYVERPEPKRYLLVLLTFTLGLMAKPMLVTLPFVLVLLDYWPLGRFHGYQFGASTLSVCASSNNKNWRSRATLLVLEKSPFFALAAVSSIVTLLAQQAGGAVKSFVVFPPTVRVANAVVSYVSYIGKTIWPHHLAPFYPHPGNSLPLWQVAGSLLLLVCISVLLLRRAEKFPYFIVGWLWYLVTLLPVIGLVQVGEQAMADRYTYVPLLGLFIMIAWGASEFASNWPYRRIAFVLAATVMLPALAVCTSKQLSHWSNTVTLFEHTLKVTADNYFAHTQLGIAFAARGELDTAIGHYSKALQIKPDYAIAHNNLGLAWEGKGRIQEAIRSYSKALQIKPDLAGAHSNLGNALQQQGKLDEAIRNFFRALQLKPDVPEVHYNMGNVLARQGEMEQAIVHLSRAVQLKPDFAEAYNNLGAVLSYQGKYQEAIDYFTEALRIKPDYLEARNNLEITLRKAGNSSEGTPETKVAPQAFN